MSERLERIGEARESIRSLTRDPMTKILLATSQLTPAQLETLLADSMAAENDVRKSQKKYFRPSGSRISRGAFNRTLIQAQHNVIRSIYTVLLMGYVGLFDTASLQPFIELADTVQGYIDEARKTGTNEPEALKHLNTRLLETISSLARRKSFKNQL